MMTLRKLTTCLAAFLFVVATCVTAAAQGRATLRGSVNDEVGAVIVGATITLTDPSGAQKTATTGNDGTFTFTGLTPGKYLLRAEAGGFAQSDDIEVNVTTARRDPTLITLKVAQIESEVKVESNPPISTDSNSNANQQVLSGKDLEALPDDPDELAAALQALAGPSIGPGGGQIFIDGFSGANLPPKEAIREIRINQNPFAAENDQPSARIDILTKPGTDKFRGSAGINFTDESLNSRNPFAITTPKRTPYQVRQYSGSVSGPIIKNKASFFLELNRNETDDNELVRATVIDPTFTIQQFGASFLVPRRNLNISPRIEYAINSRNTLIARYNYSHNSTDNQGIGGFSLPSRAYDNVNSNQTLQLTETAVINATTINETRFQFQHNTSESLGNSTIATLNVSGAFGGCVGDATGCSSVGHATNKRNSWELNNFTQIQHGLHAIKFGGRLRDSKQDDISPSNFGGAWSFTGGFGPQFDAANNPIAGTNVLLSSIERYRRTALIQANGLTAQQQAYCGPSTVAQCIRTLGGGASQFGINTGNPAADVSQFDVGFYAQDDWRVRPNFTLSYGLRYENQTNADSKFNFAPRVGFAWAPGVSANSTKPPHMVLRGGIGIFYNRFNEGQTLQANRFNGSNELAYAITDPAVILQRPPTAAEQLLNPSYAFLNTYPLVPSVAGVPANQQTIWQVAPNLQAPTVYLTGLQVERQLPKNISMFVGAYSIRILHVIRARDINAPLPPLFTTRPNPLLGDINQYESSGKFRQNQVFVGFNSRLNPRITLSANYVLSKTTNDTDGQGGALFPRNSYDLTGEYGRGGFDIRHRFTIFGTINSPWWKLVFNPFVVANTGPPFNITTGQDLNLDRQFNERPTFAQLNAYCTNLPSRCTSFDYSSTSNDFIPRNYGNSPGSISVNLRVGRTWTWGGESRSAANSRRGSGDQNARRGGGGSGGRGGPSIASAPTGGGQHGGGPGGGGPGMMMMGGGGGGGAGKYSLTFSLNGQNIFNHVNLSTPVGNLTSPNFGQSLALAGNFGGFGGPGGSSGAGNRRIYANLRFTF
jgi:carboxypeptidase family protein/TonB-dependent receptor-like protein